MSDPGFTKQQGTFTMKFLEKNECVLIFSSVVILWGLLMLKHKERKLSFSKIVSLLHIGVVFLKW